MKRTPLPLAAAAAAALLLGCTSNDGAPDLMTPEDPSLGWTFSGLEPLGGGHVYEGWLIVGGNPVSVGRFQVDGSGNPLAGPELPAGLDPSTATDFVLTIELGLGDDPAPSDTKLMGGAFAGGFAALSIAHPAALGDDFGGAAGSFILQTPSTSMIPGDHAQGIWWLDPAGGPGPILALPALPPGWAYEGWVVDGSGPISTGRFLGAVGADSDGAGPAAGPDPGPPFPGQDFISPPLVLTGLTAVITVEPEPDDSPAPFAFKPLIDASIEDPGPGVLQSMANQAGTAPSGTVALE